MTNNGLAEAVAATPDRLVAEQAELMAQKETLKEKLIQAHLRTATTREAFGHGKRWPGLGGNRDQARAFPMRRTVVSGGAWLRPR